MIGLKMNKELQLSKKFYTFDKVETAMRAFSEIADIRIQDGGGYWKSVFVDCKFDPEKTAKEFENYLICLCNKEV